MGVRHYDPRSVIITLSFLSLAGFSMDSAAAGFEATTQQAEASGVPVGSRLQMPRAELQVDWAVDRDHEVGCGGSAIAGGSTSGEAVFSHLGRSGIEASAAWDLGNLIDDPQFDPVGPAGGPVAPVLGPGQYPYEFHFDPRIPDCASGLVATGVLLITSSTGDEIHGSIQGGEAHRLDFVQPGDGVETFVIVEMSGGTGRFQNATGGFTMHTIIRFDPELGHFVVDLAETLPGGTIGY